MASAPIKTLTLAQAKAYQKKLASKGKEISNSKEAGKVADYIRTLSPGESKSTSEAFRKLSSGVTTTGGWTEANLANITKYTGETPQLTAPTASSGAVPTSKDGLPSYLDSYQNSVYGASGSPELRQSIVNQLEPTTGKPEVLNRVEEYDKMREQYGVADIEQNLTDLKTQLETEVATTRARKFDAEGKPVAVGVIAGRVGEIERQQNERIDAINRQINTATDQLNTSYNVISTYMNYKGLDYQDAVTAYNTEFSKNLQIYNLVNDKLDKQVAAARANLQIYTSAITSGNLNYSGLSQDQKLMINKLEIQSGMPIGFVSKLQMNPKDRLLNVNSDTGEALIMNPDGTFRVVKTGMTVKSSTGSSASGFKTALEKGRADLEKGYSWGSVWNRIKNEYKDASNESIDAGLGTEWREAGAYEGYKAKQTTPAASDKNDSTSAMRDAISAYNRATTDEQKTAIRKAFVQDYPTMAKQYDDAIE